MKKTKDENNLYDPPHPKIYYTVYVFDEELEYNQKAKREGANNNTMLHTQKALVISSFYQFHIEFSEILKAIKKYIEKNIEGFELEKAIHSLVFDIPAPCPGMTKVKYNYFGLYQVEFVLNPINEIPKPGSDLRTIFNLLTIRKVLELMKYIILEVPVIIFGEDKLTLSNVVKSFDELLFPFTYPYPIIPILPKAYYKSLEKLSSFIVGINQKFQSNDKDKEDFFQINNINLNDKEYIVLSLTEQDPEPIYYKKNVDKNGLILKDYTKIMEKSISIEKYKIQDANFPKHYLTKLMKNLNQLFYGKDGTRKNIKDAQNDDIRYQFYYFFISMMQHYKSFLNTESNKLIQLYSKVESDSIDINDLFKIQDFIYKDDDSIIFYTFFVKTRILKSFIIKNIYPTTIDEKLEVLLLDETIRKKKNKNMIKQLFKENTPFLFSTKFCIRDTELIKISYEEEKMHLSEIENKNENNFPLLDKDKMDLLYNKKFLGSNTKIKNLYIDFYTECQIMLKDRKFLEGYNSIGYKINLNEELKTNNENYILKLWYLIICYIFKHLDIGEKWILFNELLKEIQNMSTPYKISIIDQFLSDLMFETFIKYGDKQMCSLLYKELNDIPCVKEDYLIFTQLHKKFINKKEEFQFSLPKETLLKEKNYNIYNLPKGNRMNIALVTECPNPGCKIKVDLKPAILNFSSMTSDIIYYRCPICHENQKAVITISYGNAYNREDKYQLFTPKYLFYSIKKLGDFNMDDFYAKQAVIFFNIIVLFQLRHYSYDFIFPYKERKLTVNNKPYNGFNPEKLQEQKTGENKYIYRNPNAHKIKWYENISSTLPQRSISKFIPSKRASVGTFMNFEPLSSAAFFKKNKKKIKNGFVNSNLKHSKTINED